MKRIIIIIIFSLLIIAVVFWRLNFSQDKVDKKSDAKEPITTITDIQISVPDREKGSSNLKATYRFNGMVKEYLDPEEGCNGYWPDSFPIEYFDFNNDGKNELLITCEAGAPTINYRVYGIDNSGDMKQMCFWDYPIEDESVRYIDLERNCNMIVYREYEVRDINKDGYLDIELGFRDFDSHDIISASFKKYLYNTDKKEFVRSDN